MSSDKKITHDKLQELLKRNISNAEFIKKIEFIRGNFLPLIKAYKEEYSKKKEYYAAWEEEYNMEDEINILIKEYKLPLTILQIIKMYIIYEDEFTNKIKLNNSYNCELEMVRIKNDFLGNDYSPTHNEWIKGGEDFIKLYIPRSANIKEISSFLSNSKKEIQKFFGERKRIRRGVNHERDKLILHYSNLDKKSLKQIVIDNDAYSKDKYQSIANLLIKIHSYDKCTSDMVKKVINKKLLIKSSN